MDFTFDVNLFSDFHKDARGFRPRQHPFYRPDTTDEQKQEMWDDILDECDREMIRSEKQEIADEEAFEARIHDCQTHGAESREQAIRWIFLSDGLTERDFCYKFGLIRYNYGIGEKYRDEITEIIENWEVDDEM